MRSAQDHHRLSSRERLVLGLLALFAIGCMIAAVIITSQVLARIGGYGTARDDNLQWTISQIEVDRLKFQRALDRLDPASPDTLDAVRQRFDLLYSRAVTLRTAPAYRDALAGSRAAGEVNRVIALLDEAMPIIDGGDAALVAARDRLEDHAERMTPPIRRIAAEALAIDARRSDGERRQLTAQIVTLSGLSGLMFVALFSLLVLVWRLYRGRLDAEAAMATARGEALAAEQARARFLGMTSHEMRTPLNGLLGALELLEDSTLDAGQAEQARIMRLSGEALRSHIDEALTELDPAAGGPALHPEPFDLDALMADLVAAQRIAAEARGNTLRRDLGGGEIGAVLGDARRLGQVLLNLVANAIKFTQGGEITLAARRGGGDMVEFAVCDTGIGIAEADLQAIFEDFIRLPEAGEAQAGGSGLGLGIARRIVAAMGGRIEVKSRPGAGSTFTVRVPLPAVAGGAVEMGDEAAGGDAPALPRALRVLLVEDTDASRAVTRAMLVRDGHEVQLAHDGQEAVEAAAQTPFDLILMDVAMPRLDGIEASRRIRAGGGANAATRIVAFTAYHGEETAARLRVAGVDAIEVKPLSRAQLRALMTQAAQEAALIDASHLAQMRGALPEAQMKATMAALGAEAEALVADLAGGRAPRDLAARIHALAGSAGACGAALLHARLTAIEAAIEARDEARARALCDGLGAVWTRTHAALRRHGISA
ncbi:signal transduction histidine kinase/CheY-like chemotaxis protein [Roseovarius sp. MBR-78]|jgi:signal transduction histidine kinase/CheY-like chemotaxis protein|uniref:ATP-binding protein n=1 Tax=Roseovarius sp. MBR-78 TaxID=3156460 RepID=UPI00339A4475